MGDGSLIPFNCRPCKIPLGNFIALNDGIGGGTFSPSTVMQSFPRKISG
jgi:hypothetical protein